MGLGTSRCVLRIPWFFRHKLWCFILNSNTKYPKSVRWDKYNHPELQKHSKSSKHLMWERQSEKFREVLSSVVTSVYLFCWRCLVNIIHCLSFLIMAYTLYKIYVPYFVCVWFFESVFFRKQALHFQSDF